MANSYEGMGRLCEDLKRLGELEKLFATETQGVHDPIINDVMLPIYQAEHNKLVRKVIGYVSQNYSGDTLAFALDFYHHMIGEKEDAVEEAVAIQARLVEAEREAQKKKREELISRINDLRKFLHEHYEIKDSEG
ncbi:Uncharacterised protein [uncultured archaeon]|nr:Uncharacterised protein [uncultured archaeon]